MNIHTTQHTGAKVNARLPDPQNKSNNVVSLSTFANSATEWHNTSAAALFIRK